MPKMHELKMHQIHQMSLIINLPMESSDSSSDKYLWSHLLDKFSEDSLVNVDIRNKDGSIRRVIALTIHVF